MSIKIVVNSSTDFDEEIAKRANILKVPFVIRLDGEDNVDDEQLDLERFRDHLESCKEFKTACPPVGAYYDAFEGDEDVFVITISSKLSGSYQSAVEAKRLYIEDHGEKFIHIIDSKSASAGETALLVRLIELIEAGLTAEEIAPLIDQFEKDAQIYFILESLNNLAKAGRVNQIVARAASMLSIRCIMGRTPRGEIDLKEKIVGEKKAFRRLARMIKESGPDLSERVLCISHCRAAQKAELLLREIEAVGCKFRQVHIISTFGLASCYADIGGLVLGF